MAYGIRQYYGGFDLEKDAAKFYDILSIKTLGFKVNYSIY